VASLIRHNLPAQPTALVGRQREITALRRALLSPGVGLLTLTGAPGIGKTRLALAVTASLLDYFQDGSFFVDLAPITDHMLVPSAIAEALGVQHTEQAPVLDAVAYYLKDRQILLLLDNFEHLLDAGIQVSLLLAECPRVKVLATSREPLRLRLEHVFPVPSLDLPDMSASDRLTEVASSPAVQLFVERAVAANPNFELREENAEIVGRICSHADGIPLAIELAAGESDVLRPQDMLHGLAQRGLGLFGAGPQDLPERQRTLRATIAWSYELLSADEQALLRRLAVFSRGGTLEAAGAVCCLHGAVSIDLPDLVSALVRKNLLVLEDTTGREPRFRALEMVRECGLEKLNVLGELAVMQDRHAAFFLALAEQAEPFLNGPEQEDWLARLDREHDNLRAALRWLWERKDTELGLRLAGALWYFWRTRGHNAEGRRHLEGLLAIETSSVGASARAKALFGAGELARIQGDADAARSRFREALLAFRELGDKSGTAQTLRYLAIVDFYTGDLQAAYSSAEESLALFRELPDKQGIAQGLNLMGQIGNLTRDYERTRLFLEESLAISQALGNKWHVGAVLTNLGITALHLGDLMLARSCCLDALRIGQEMADRYRLAYALALMAALAATVGQPEQALRLAGAAAALRDVISAPLYPFIQAEFERFLAPARESLTQEVAAQAWRDGSQMSLEQAIECAQAGEMAPAPVVSTRSKPVEGVRGLSSRERLIAVLIARGRTNREIAAELVISERTVDTHVTHILAKLVLTSRSQVAATVASEGLLVSEDREQTFR